MEGQVYGSQDGLKYELQERCMGNVPYGQSRKEFPREAKSFLKAFCAVEEKMNEEWHSKVNIGAAVAGDGILTDHGEKHVQEVIRHAFEIITDVNQLTGYEIFILLLAIHFHDVGNIYGREKHEKQIVTIMEKLGDTLPIDRAEKQIICDIATSHGGNNCGDKDTIKYVSADRYYSSVMIRPKVLASILRFADEISDDLRRANYPGAIPKENEVFHEYSKSLDPVTFDGDKILMHFRIPYVWVKEKVGKGTSKIFLYDEILIRITKCMRELEYCKKYSEGLIKLNGLSVKIDILEEGSEFRAIQDAGESFRLSVQGYPSEMISTLTSYLEENNHNEKKARLRYDDGEQLRNSIIKGDIG